MSIATEITRLQNAKASIKSSIESKGVTVPSSTKLDGYSTLIDSISGGSTINNQNKTLTQNGQYTADSGYTGLGTVTVNVPEPTGNINITDTNQTNVKDYATAQVVDADLVAGNIKKDVNILGVTGTYEGSGGDISEYFDDKIDSGGSGSGGWTRGIKKLPQYTDLLNEETTSLSYAFSNYKGTTIDISHLLTSLENINNMSYMFFSCPNLITLLLPSNFSTITEQNLTNTSNMFYGCSSLTTIPEFKTNNVTNTSKMFYGCSNITSIPLFNISNSTDTSSMFQDCTSLTTIPLLNVRNATNMASMFRGCTSLTTIPELYFYQNRNFNYMFYNCTNFTTFPQNLNTGAGTSFESMFQNCTSLITVPPFDTSRATTFKNMFNGCSNLTTLVRENYNHYTNGSACLNVNSMFNGCSNLTTFNGLKNLGKAYTTTTSANYSNYKLDLSDSPLLTYNSLLNIIDSLYDIATKGCNTQSLVLGATNLAKLSASEIQAGTDKGWSIS